MKLGIHVMLYNKLNLFKEAFQDYLNISEHENVNLYVSDDSTNDDISNFLRLQDENKIVYRRNTGKHGHDNNYINIFKSVTDEYFWVVPDYFLIKAEFIDSIILSLKQGFDFDCAILNINDRLKCKGPIVATNLRSATDLIWHVTLTGSVLYNRNVLDDINYEQALSCKNFPQLFLYIKTIQKYKKFILIKSPEIQVSNLKKGSYWSAYVFDIFFNDVYNCLIVSGFSKSEALRIVRIHAINSQVMSIKYYIKKRLDKSLKIADIIKYRKYFTFFYFISAILVILFLPAFLVSFLNRKRPVLV